MVLGPCTGPIAQIPVLSDFSIFNQNTGFLWFGGEIKSDDAGSAEFHMQKSGQCDLMADSDEEAIRLARQLLEFTPLNCWEKPTVIESTDDPARQEEALLDVMPDDPKFTYDIHEIIDLIVDHGEFFELNCFSTVSVNRVSSRGFRPITAIRPIGFPQDPQSVIPA